jgi:hypothetical protein
MPIAWQETEDNDEQAILSNFVDDLWVWDCDGGGEDIYWFGFSNGKFFKVYHEFYAYYGEPEYDGDNGFEVKNYFDITEVIKEEAMPHLCADRDWIQVASYGRW